MKIQVVIGFDENGQWVVVLGLRLKNNPHETKVHLTETNENANIANKQETLASGVSVGDVGNVGAIPLSPVCVGVTENTPTLPTCQHPSIIDQSIPLYEAVKKESLNSINIVGFVGMVQGAHPDITKNEIINYLEHIGRLTPKAKSNGDKSCIICGKPGRHKSTTVVDRNTEVIEWRCDACYEQYQRGPGVTT